MSDADGGAFSPASDVSDGGRSHLPVMLVMGGPFSSALRVYRVLLP